jgi:hypothetical protein
MNDKLEKYIRVSQSALRLAASYADSQSQINRLYAMVAQLEVMDDELHTYVPTWIRKETES